MKRIIPLLSMILFFSACSSDKDLLDASGAFEAREIIVSAGRTGKIISLDVTEGQQIDSNMVVGFIDKEELEIQKQQVNASIDALHDKTIDEEPQVKMLLSQLAVQQTQLAGLEKEKQRIDNLVRAEAATIKQSDDIHNQVAAVRKQMEVTRRQISVQKNTISTQNQSILSEAKPLNKKAAQLDYLIDEAKITNPVKGTVLSKYIETGEMVTAGKALYKIADLSAMDLKAYITGDQFSELRLGQELSVFVDQGKKERREYLGRVTWISDKAEFTPKTIQTRDERANLVYAVKIRVRNDGYLKIGMYGEASFRQNEKQSK